MEKEILVIYDKVGKTLDVWFEQPKDAICEETEEEFLIKKDPVTGEVIGFEKFNITLTEEIPAIKFLVKDKAQAVAV
jgi:uncharacterized protein YuzE